MRSITLIARAALTVHCLTGSVSRDCLSILENEAEKKLGVTLDEVLKIHRDSYLCMLCDMIFLKMSELRQKIAELESFPLFA